MRILKYTNSRGESLTFKNRSSFIITKINGLGDVEADIQTQRSPYQDGDTPIDTTLEPRYIDFEVFFRGTDDTDVSEKRSRLSRVFNPKLGEGKFELQYGDIKREIFAISKHVPNYPLDVKSNGVMNQKAQINLKCPNPYWQSPIVTEEPAFEPRFHFPFSGPFIMGLQRDRRIINNDGDAPAPLQVEFFGPALNPKIINNTTGEFIKINQMLKENEKMMINTTDGIKSVFFVVENGGERNVFHWIDLGSTFFDLVVGENDIEYTADSDVQGAIVNISYSKQYVGV